MTQVLERRRLRGNQSHKKGEIILSQLEVDPFTDLSVKLYKIAMIKRHSNFVARHEKVVQNCLNTLISLFLITTAICIASAIVGFVTWPILWASGNSTFPASYVVQWGMLGFLCSMTLCIVLLKITDAGGMVKEARWTTGFFKSYTGYIPPEARAITEAILARHPNADMRVETLEVTSRVVDPFLTVQFDGDPHKYHIFVWDEPHFKK